MTDDTMTPEDTKNGDGKALQIAVGSALWKALQMRNEGGEKMTPEQRKAAWDKAKPEMRRFANRLIRKLDDAGYSITPKT